MGIFEMFGKATSSGQEQNSIKESGPQIRKATSLELIHTEFSKTADNGTWFFNKYFEPNNVPPFEIVFEFKDEYVDGLEEDSNCRFPCKIRRDADDPKKYFGIVYADKSNIPAVDEWLSGIMHAEIISNSSVEKSEDLYTDQAA